MDLALPCSVWNTNWHAPQHNMAITHAQAGPLPLVRVDGRQQHTHNIVLVHFRVLAWVHYCMRPWLQKSKRRSIASERADGDACERNNTCFDKLGSQTMHAPCHMHACMVIKPGVNERFREWTPPN
jgi:hypothetical protein